MSEGFYLTGEDARLIRAYLQRRTIATLRRAAQGGIQNAPDVYVGRTPDGSKIPARDGLVVGQATVEVYKLVEYVYGWRIEKVRHPDGTVVTLTVYNIDDHALKPDFYELIADAFGKVLVSCCG